MPGKYIKIKIWLLLFFGGCFLVGVIGKLVAIVRR